MKKAHQEAVSRLCILLVAFLFFNLKAQSQQIRGKIIDSTTQQPVPGATVSSNKQKVLSDPEGNFTINADKGSTLTCKFYWLQRTSRYH
jgi:hypothetical protein